MIKLLKSIISLNLLSVLLVHFAIADGVLLVRTKNTPDELIQLGNVISSSLAYGIAVNEARNGLGVEAYNNGYPSAQTPGALIKSATTQSPIETILRSLSLYDLYLTTKIRLQKGFPKFDVRYVILPSEGPSDIAQFPELPALAALTGTLNGFGGTILKLVDTKVRSYSTDDQVRKNLSTRIESSLATVFPDSSMGPSDPRGKAEWLIRSYMPVAAEGSFITNDTVKMARTSIYLPAIGVPKFSKTGPSGAIDPKSWTIEGFDTKKLPPDVFQAQVMPNATVHRITYSATPGDKGRMLRLESIKDFLSPNSKDLIDFSISFGRIIRSSLIQPNGNFEHLLVMDADKEMSTVNGFNGRNFKDALMAHGRIILQPGFFPQNIVTPDRLKKINEFTQNLRVQMGIHKLYLKVQRPSLTLEQAFDGDPGFSIPKVDESKSVMSFRLWFDYNDLNGKHPVFTKLIKGLFDCNVDTSSGGIFGGFGLNVTDDDMPDDRQRGICQKTFETYGQLQGFINDKVMGEVGKGLGANVNGSIATGVPEVEKRFVELQNEILKQFLAGRELARTQAKQIYIKSSK